MIELLILLISLYLTFFFICWLFESGIIWFGLGLICIIGALNWLFQLLPPDIRSILVYAFGYIFFLVLAPYVMYRDYKLYKKRKADRLVAFEKYVNRYKKTEDTSEEKLPPI
jgi:hypothetical protein